MSQRLRRSQPFLLPRAPVPCPLYLLHPSPQAISFPTLPVTTEITDLHCVSPVGSCVRCWVWSVRPSTSLKQLQFLYYKEKKQQHEDSGSATRHGILISPFSHFLLVPSLPSLPSYLRDQSFFRARACAPRRALDGRSQGTLRLHIPACFGFSFFLSMPKLCVFVSHGRNHFDFELNI